MADIKAAYYTGDKTFSVETKASVDPGPDQVEIDVAYCGICGTDLHVYLGHMDARIGNHRVIGHEMSGVVSAIGSNVSNAKVGDHVVVRPLDACNECPACKRGYKHVCQNLDFLGLDTDGAFQEKWTVPSHTIHDVRRGRVQQGDDVLVIGGGPIGMLVAMAAKNAGGNVTVSEINESRLAMAEKLGIGTLNPKNVDATKTIMEQTDNKGADVVFEVSGTQPGVDLMTAAVATRGRVVMVAIHAAKAEVDLFQFFWKEIEMLGARVYEPEDYDKAIALVANGGIDAKELITGIQALDNIGDAFAELSGSPTAMKTLIKCSGVSA